MLYEFDGSICNLKNHLSWNFCPNRFIDTNTETKLNTTSQFFMSLLDSGGIFSNPREAMKQKKSKKRTTSKKKAKKIKLKKQFHLKKGTKKQISIALHHKRTDFSQYFELAPSHGMRHLVPIYSQFLCLQLPIGTENYTRKKGEGKRA